MRIFSIFTFVFYSLFAVLNATAKPVPVEHYSRMPVIYDAALSPDGNFLAAVADNDGSYIIRVINLNDPTDKKVRAIKYAKGVKILWVKWANNDVLLASTREKTRFNSNLVDAGYLYALNKDLTTNQMLLVPKSKKGAGRRFRETELRQFNNRVINFLPKDPDHILMSYGLYDRMVEDVVKVNVRTKAVHRIKQGERSIQAWRTDLRGIPRIGIGTNETTRKPRMIVRDAKTDMWRDVSNYPGLTPGTNVYGFTANVNEIIIGAYGGKDTLGLFIYDLVQKKQTRKLFQNDKYDANGIVRSADGSKVIGVSYIGDVSQTEFFDPAYRTRIDNIHAILPQYHISYIDQTPDGQKIVFKASAASVPNSLMYYDAKTKKVKLIAEDYPEIGATIQGDVTVTSYKARDGFEIPAYITTPPKIADGMPLKNLPFIVMPHGGPYARDTHSFDYLAQFMASRGYGVLQMNFRGSKGYGRAFEEAGRKNWVLMQEDVEDGTRWLIKKGYADPKRICIVGWSYGGYAALMGAIKDPDLYTCAASMAGVTDLHDMVTDLKRFRFGRRTAQNFILNGFEDRDAIKENSPVKRASEITIPLMLAHGERDTVVYFDQFTRMKKALKKSSSKVTYLVLEDEDHQLSSSSNRHTFFRTLDKFLHKNLGDSAAAP